MTFLTPLFLLGLAALAVPVLVHLTQRERASVVEFPSLMFLRKIPVRVGEAPAHPRLAAAGVARGGAGADRRGVRAAVRARVGAVGAAGGAREVVVLLDRSYSMGGGPLGAGAQAARQALDTSGRSTGCRWCCSRPRRRTGAAVERRCRAGAGGD
jgi:hypothetical protein